MPLITRRWSFQGRPRLCWGSKGSITAHLLIMKDSLNGFTVKRAMR
jgi:hypothetical protein